MFWWATGLAMAFFTLFLYSLVSGARELTDYGAGCEGSSLGTGMVIMLIAKMALFFCVFILAIGR